jgi:predicted Zn finger-like uncharacterized protein
MIITCPHCDEKMRVDESRLPSVERAKVRCPHCKEIISLGDQAKQPGQVGAPGISAEGPQRAASSGPGAMAGERKNVARGKAMDHEPTFPKDAFQNFQGPRSSTLKIILWIVGSAAIIGFFALLVNLVLPGPYGDRSIGRSGKTEQTLPQMPVDSERLNPDFARPGSGR